MRSVTFFEERRQLINETFDIFKSLEGKVANSSSVTATIPKIDNLIMSQKNFFLNQIKQKSKRTIGHLTYQKLLHFKNVKTNSIMKMFEKTFEKYNQNIDYLDERINVSMKGLEKGIENSKADMEGALSDKRQELEAQLKTMQNGFDVSIETMQSRLKDTEEQLKKKYNSEVVRLTDHFEKIVAQREETLNLTSGSLKKAQEDLQTATKQRETEVRSIIVKNDEILETHKESLMSKIVVDEQKADELEKEFNEVFKTHSTLGPELDRKWREKSKQMKEEYAEEDDLFEMDMKAKRSVIEDLIRQLNETNSTYQAQKIDIDDKMAALKQIYQKNIQKIIDSRQEEVEKAKQKALDEHKRKEAKMQEALQNLKNKIIEDAQHMRDKINDKSSAHVDKIKALEDDQKRALKELDSEKQRIRNEIESMKNTWDSDRQNIINTYEQDIEKTYAKSKAETKYFEAKIAALQKELESIILENSQIENENRKHMTEDDLNEIDNYEKNLKDAENHLENELKNGMDEKIQMAVEEKLSKLRDEHSKEKQKLIDQMNQLQSQENDIKSKPVSTPQQDERPQNEEITQKENENETNTPLSERNNNASNSSRSNSDAQQSPEKQNTPTNSKIFMDQIESNSSEKDKKLTRVPSSTVKQLTVITEFLPQNEAEGEKPKEKAVSKKKAGKLAPSYATQEFLDSQIDKWREDYLIDTKNLKQEEAIALKKLEESKQEFQQAVQHMNVLRDKLAQTTKEYSEAIKQSETENEEELMKLKSVIEEKEKLLSQLEMEFEENEHELKRKARQIEAVEDKLLHLKEHLDQSKEQIRKKIKDEYQPLIRQAQKSNDEKINKLRELKNELELQLEYLKNDLFVVESANVAMEESLRKETADMIEKLKNELTQQCAVAEEEFSHRLNDKEVRKQEKIAKKLVHFEKEKQANIEEFEEAMNEMKIEHEKALEATNNECMQILSNNTEKKQKIASFANIKCDKCDVLQKHIKQLEKDIVKLQIQCRNCNLEESNNLNLYKTFKPLLPPLKHP